MGLLIDSNVWIEAERGRFSMPAFLSSRGSEAVAISAITASELLHGTHRARDPLVRERRLAFVSRILDSVPVLPFDLHVARIHAALSAALAAKGSPIGAHDLIIAATALSLEYAVVSFNDAVFQAVPELTVIKPASSR